METVNINGVLRNETGKKANKAVRKEGLVPCVIYGGEKVIHFNAVAKDFKSLLYSPGFKTVEISIDGTSYKSILKDTQFHPVTDELLHLDFLELVSGKKLNVEIPVQCKGAAPGVKEGGTLLQKLRRVKIKTTPEYLVDELFVDISDLKLNHSIRVKDIEINEHMEIMTSLGIPVASVETPRALKSAEAGEEEEEGAETEETTEAEA